ncbi:L,D-transpeptidase family protein [Mangrovicella endophytica]|uniref:L,D-transpeptidase family protein n=1 Tax=Mangrovicella endophytica TaxID=2066697 RepID=UPI001FE14141|nr:L,D-transpeptidase [Mangrovicella endophytica]
MKNVLSSAVLAASLCASVSALAQTAASAPAASEDALSATAIDGATFDEWQARQAEAKAIADAAKADPTIGDVKPADQADDTAPAAGEDGADKPTADSGAAAEAPAPDAPGADTAATATPPEPGTSPNAASEDVPVAGMPGAVVETPDNSTDVPDEAGQQVADKPKLPDPFLIRMQVLLDRAHVSPGVIDGLEGENTRKAIAAYEALRKLPVDGEPDADFWTVLVVDQGQAMKSYEITQDDLSQRFVPDLPEDYGKLAKLEFLGYSGPVEMLAERFHMDEDLLKALNPGADFTKAGTTIIVADPGGEPETKVARIVVDKPTGELTAYDADGGVVVAYPATIGSKDTPSPTGTVKVKGIAPDPTYSYDPSKNFKQGDNSEKLTLPAGPNGPVGDMWIDLDRPTYGIHGTPHPETIDKAASHGCVRLANWDAKALAKLVEPGKTVVEFKG